jgi:hypothetical protein
MKIDKARIEAMDQEQSTEVAFALLRESERIGSRTEALILEAHLDEFEEAISSRNHRLARERIDEIKSDLANLTARFGKQRK